MASLGDSRRSRSRTMRRGPRTFRLLLAVELALSLAACAPGYRDKKTSGDLSFTLSSESPPLRGRMPFKLDIADRSDRPVGDATVEVRYRLPPMPGMSSAEEEVQVSQLDGHYGMGHELHTAATWNVRVVARRPGVAPVEVSFAIKVL